MLVIELLIVFFPPTVLYYLADNVMLQRSAIVHRTALWRHPNDLLLLIIISYQFNIMCG